MASNHHTAQRGVPDWVVALVGRLAGAFYLNGWQITALPDNDIRKPEGHEGSDGLAEMQTRYRNATLYFDRDLPPDRYGLEVVTHELLHVVLVEMREMVHHMLRDLPKARRRQYSDLYDYAEERLITTLARGLATHFDLRQWITEEGDMTAMGGLLTIASGESRSAALAKKSYGKGLQLYVPASVDGVIGFEVSHDNTTFSPLVDKDDNLVFIAPSDLPVTPCWREMPLSVYAAHYLRLVTYTDATGTALQAQGAERAFEAMGIG